MYRITDSQKERIFKLYLQILYSEGKLSNISYDYIVVTGTVITYVHSRCDY